MTIEQPTHVRTLYVDIRDLYEYALHNTTLSGIQRVTANLAKAADAWCTDNPGHAIVLVVPDYAASEIFAVDRDAVLSIVAMMEAQATPQPVVNAAVKAMYAARRRVEPRAGDVFVMVGAFWICSNFGMMAALRRRGVAFGLFVHDLIQIRYPEYVHAGANEAFRLCLVDALATAHFAMANSHHVAGEVRDFAAGQMGLDLPVEAVPLATELPRLPPSDEAVEPRALALPPEGFVLCVGTLEIRKNHMYLIRIWERLLAEGGVEVPALVLVGKWGWDVEALRRYVKTKDLGGRLHVFNNVSDVTLAHLYRTCLFTAYPSFAEGFGLPVGESLAYGKPCVTSNVTSLPEVGGAFARYLDPFDLDQGFGLIRALLADRPALAAWAREVAEGFRPKSWPQFAKDFYDTTLHLADQAATASPEVNTSTAPGVRYEIGDRDSRRLKAAALPLSTIRVGCIEGWHGLEGWGAWASAPTAIVRFRTPLPEGSRIAISLVLQPPRGRRFCAVEAGSGLHRLDLGKSRRAHEVEGRAGEGGIVEIRFTTAEPPARPDARDLYLGLLTVAWCPADDTATRAVFAAEGRRLRRQTLLQRALRLVPRFKIRRRR